MHGTLRFILASMVALSHFGVKFYGYNIGVVAVVLFYLLAGMVAYKLNSNIYNFKALPYYRDRIKRIFPLYLLILLFAYILYLAGTKSYFISAVPNFFDYIANITIIPLAYYMYNGLDKFTLIPPAWSLGVELQFYILAPFLLRSSRYINIGILFSLMIYIFASLGYINTDYFGYRLLAGVLFIFLIGALIQKSLYTNQLNYFIVLIYFILLLLVVYLFYIGYKKPYNIETLSALLIGIPLLYYFKLRIPKRIDKYLGELSYSLFLSHFPSIWFMKLILHQTTIAPFYQLIVSILTAISFLYIYYKIKL